MSGKTYFITGANRGIGFQVVSQLASEPSNTVIAAIRDTAKPSSDLAALAASNPKVKFVKLDVGSQEDIDSLPEQLQTVLGENAAIDVFLSNAGIGEVMDRTLDTTNRAKWIDHYAINSLGPILTFQKLYPYLSKSNHKQAVFTSSVMGSIGNYWSKSSAAYGQSKAALNYSIKALSDELKDEGFTLVSIHPGVVATDLIEDSKLDLEGIEMLTTEEAAKRQLVFLNKLDNNFNGKFWCVSSDQELIY